MLGYFNMEPTNPIMITFMTENNFVNIIKSNICFKIASGGCIDLILTNKPKEFSGYRSNKNKCQ